MWLDVDWLFFFGGECIVWRDVLRGSCEVVECPPNSVRYSQVQSGATDGDMLLRLAGHSHVMGTCAGVLLALARQGRPPLPPRALLKVTIVFAPTASWVTTSHYLGIAVLRSIRSAMSYFIEL